MNMQAARNKTIDFAILLTLSFLLYFPIQVHAANNPGPTFMPVTYRETQNGQDIHTTCTIQNTAYIVGANGWCTENHRTPQNNQYDHAHIPNGFPFMDTFNNNNQVTVDKVNWTYAAMYGGWSKKSDATMACNCHNHAMAGDAPPLIASTANGSTKWFTDSAYHAITSPTAGSILFTQGHSSRIEEIWDCTVIGVKDGAKKISDKSDSGGVYELSYASPGLDIPILNLYAK